MRRNTSRFSDLTPEANGAPATRPGSGGAAGRSDQRRVRLPRGLLIGGVVAVSMGVVGLLGMGSCQDDHGTDRGAGASVRVAHGPTAVTDGVPVGYSRDREGAATAAVNTVQALTQAGQGRIAMDAVQAALLARDPGPHLRASIQIGRDRPAGHDVVNLVPAAASVTAHTPSSARVMVWTMAVSRAAIAEGAPVSVITAWATHTVELVWERGDWKAKEATGRVGPLPEEAVAPGAESPLSQPLQSGYYTVYVN